MWLALSVLVACPPVDTGDGIVDVDQDGVAAEVDCDDNDPSISPEAQEIWYDGIDQDCAGGDDYDADADGDRHDEHGGQDCDDTDYTVNSSSADTWYDGVDQDCDGRDDYDQDEDGHASAEHLDSGEDCDDEDPDVNPDAPEVWYDGLDQDCDGASDYDADGDGDDAEAYEGGDCDDTDPSIASTVSETWYDDIDQDCAGGDDHDADLDGFQAEASGGEDCDDASSEIYPDAPEWCNDGTDSDCDGEDDECTAEAAAAVLSHSGGSIVHMAGGGDLDGDGTQDLLMGVGASLYPVFGPVTGQDLSTALDSLGGIAPGSINDDHVAFAGDVDGDGYDDVLVTTDSQTYGVFSGPFTGSLGVADALATITVTSGGGLDAGHDVDGDGVADLLVQDGTSDAARLYSGLARGETASGDQLGSYSVSDAISIALVTDYDGDGLGDVAVGDYSVSAVEGYARSWAGAAYLWLGDEGSTSNADLIIYGPEEKTYMGYRVADAGDLNNDGYGDLAIGSGGEAQVVTIAYGPTTGTISTWSGSLDFLRGTGIDGFGQHVESAGDVDGDGADDLLVAAEDYDTSTTNDVGAVLLYYGPPPSSGEPACIFEGNEPRYGMVASDTDGDGHSDLLISDGYSAYLFLGQAW